ncbi:hypothetical protein [Candidatus Nitrososphaera sp. FF02]|jgi:hypothetical protein
MEPITSIALVALGFAPTYGAMEVAWRMAKKSKSAQLAAPRAR